MSYFENFLKANQAYVELHGDLHLSIKPKTKVAIVTCMDSRLHVAPALGLALGDAHILRNAGGRVTEDMKLLRECPLIPDDVIISGAVYDVDTGSMREVY